jgi:hypothetical protein
MDRRAALRLLSASAAAAVIPDDLTGLGRTLHARLGAGATRRVLDSHQDATVVALTDLILPATDTPGATAARVNEFIDLLLAEWCDAAECAQFQAGLAMVDRRAHAAFGKAFVAGTPAEQTALLTALDDDTARWAASPPATRGPEPFYRRLKWLTLFGYFTSQIGAEQERHFQIVPGRYVPCAPADSLAGME